jgi:hypothetical protein
MNRAWVCFAVGQTDVWQHTTIYVSGYYYIGPHTTACVRTLLYVCAHTTMHVSNACDTTIRVCAYYYARVGRLRLDTNVVRPGQQAQYRENTCRFTLLLLF